jgi:hypothetical protein
LASAIAGLLAIATPNPSVTADAPTRLGIPDVTHHGSLLDGMSGAKNLRHRRSARVEPKEYFR